MRWQAIVIGLCVTGAMASAAPALGSVSLGQLAPTTSGAGSCADADYAQFHVNGGLVSYTALETGTITSWSHNAAPGASQQLSLKVLRSVGDPHLYDYQVVGLDGPRDLTPGETNTFAVQIPVRTLDILDLNAANGTTACTFSDNPQDTILTNPGYLGLGQIGSFTPTVDGSHLNVSAVLEPRNVVDVRAVTRNKKEGTATLDLALPNPGYLTGSGKGVRAASGGGARISRYYGLPGRIHVLVGAGGKQKSKLNRTGRVKLKVILTYTPDNGAPGSQSLKVRLRKKL
jgi:hypothetical protein